MAEPHRDPSEAPEEREPYTPASPVKRIIAWVGVAYMVVLVLLNFYALMRGEYLRGIAPLMVCPGAAGMAAIALYQFRKSTGGRRAAMALLAVVSAAVFLLGLVDGIPALATALGGAT